MLPIGNPGKTRSGGQRRDVPVRANLPQVLATGDAPEGLLAVPRRQLPLAGNEDDGTLSLLRARAGRGRTGG